MNLPIDTCENGALSFAIRGEYDKRVYAKNLGLGGGHFPATAVCVVYQLCGRVRDNGACSLLQGGSKQPYRRDILNARDGSY